MVGAKWLCSLCVCVCIHLLAHPYVLGSETELFQGYTRSDMVFVYLTIEAHLHVSLFPLSHTRVHVLSCVFIIVPVLGW